LREISSVHEKHPSKSAEKNNSNECVKKTAYKHGKKKNDLKPGGKEGDIHFQESKTFKSVGTFKFSIMEFTLASDKRGGSFLIQPTVFTIACKIFKHQAQY